MPNGFHGSQDEWKHMEAPLLEIDHILTVFGKRYGMKLSKNYHDWPERSLVWGGDVRHLIQIYLENEKTMTWNVWLCASQDRATGRFWKNQFLRRAVPFQEIHNVLEQLLEEARNIVTAWSERYLERIGET